MEEIQGMQEQVVPAVQKKPAKWLVPAIIVGAVIIAAVVYFAFFNNSGNFLKFRKTKWGMNVNQVVNSIGRDPDDDYIASGTSIRHLIYNNIGKIGDNNIVVSDYLIGGSGVTFETHIIDPGKYSDKYEVFMELIDMMKREYGDLVEIEYAYSDANGEMHYGKENIPFPEEEYKRLYENGQLNMTVRMINMNGERMNIRLTSSVVDTKSYEFGKLNKYNYFELQLTSMGVRNKAY